MPRNDELMIGLVSISDRASTGVYEDKGIPALQEWFGRRADHAVAHGNAADRRRRAAIEQTLIEPGRPQRLPPGADHRRHRPGAARRHARRQRSLSPTR